MDIMDIARFWSAVDVGHIEECWPWKKRRGAYGHGDFKVDGKNVGTHRVAFALAYGEIPEGMLVRHSCDNPACCNPKHLLTGSHLDNVRDRVIRRRGAIGERAGRAKLTSEKVYEIRAAGGTRAEIAAAYGISIHSVTAIRQRRCWKHLPERV